MSDGDLAYFKEGESQPQPPWVLLRQAPPIWVNTTIRNLGRGLKVVEDGSSILDSGDWGRLNLPFFLIDTGTVWSLQGSRLGPFSRPGKGTHIIAQAAIKALGVNRRGGAGSWYLGRYSHLSGSVLTRGRPRRVLCQLATQALREVPCFLSLDGKNLGRETALRKDAEDPM